MLECNTSQLAEYMWPFIKSDIPICLIGKTAVGKSEVVHKQIMPRIAREYGESVLHDPRVSTKDVVDGTGIPIIDQEERATYWTRPAFIPADDGKMHVMFIDEFGHATVPMQHLLYGFVNERALGQWPLPRKNRVILATNELTDKGGDMKILEPLKRRMAWIRVVPDHKSWCSGWAVENGIDPRIIAFIRLRPELFHRPDDVNPAWPVPPKHEWLNRILKTETDLKVIQRCATAISGQAFAAQFIGFLENLTANLPRLQEIRANPHSARVPQEVQFQYVIAQAIVPHITAKDAAIWAIYLKRLAPDVASMAAHQAQKVIGQQKDLQSLII